MGTPVDIEHSGYESLTAFLEASAEEGLIEIKEIKQGMVVTGKSRFHMVEGWFNKGTYRRLRVALQRPIAHSSRNFKGHRGETEGSAWLGDGTD